MYTGEYEFVTEQIELYGETYVNGLVELGFKPVHTAAGWSWGLDTLTGRQTVKHDNLVLSR